MEGEGKQIRLVPTQGLKTLFEGSNFTFLPGGHGPEPLSRVFPQPITEEAEMLKSRETMKD